MIIWLELVITLPTANATVRMRIWRMLKGAGAAVLRDGVYLLPERDDCRSTLAAAAAEVQAAGGSAYLLRVEESEGVPFAALFDRTADFAVLLDDVDQLRRTLSGATAAECLRQVRKLRRSFAALAGVDFFPGAAQAQAETALGELEQAAAGILAPDEPHPVAGAIPRRRVEDYRGRVWATRRRPWVDRLACAWLIRRCIDPQARFLWLESPADCPPEALGFDFDGAAFTHVGARVSFEVLLASFGLDRPALRRLGALVHYLDVGGVEPAEASGVACVLAGQRAAIADDDALFVVAAGVFEGLLIAFEREET